MRVLLADDSEIVRVQLGPMLEREGYEVVLAEDGEQAWEALRSGQIRLAVVDWMMPKVDGVLLCRRLQEDHRLRHVYVILLTAKTADEDIVAALAAGASDFLSKPFAEPELFARLQVGERLIKLQLQLAQAEKLEALGRLAGGVAHEINSPTQFVCDNTRFLSDAFNDYQQVLTLYQRLLSAVRASGAEAALVREIEELSEKVELNSLLQQVPVAAQQTLDGVERVAHTVRGLKEFAHPRHGEKRVAFDLNRAVQNVIAVSRSEWKEVAEVVAHLEPALQAVPCLHGEIYQALLNLVVNAAQSISDRVDSGGPKGIIVVSTHNVERAVEVRIKDNGPGIAAEIRERVFDPFFTTRPSGKGSGQGLAVARAAVVEIHGGVLELESEVGKGTTFIVRLPTEVTP